MELTVSKVSESKTKGNFITKLVHKSEASINSDGLPLAGQQVTYYIMLSAQLPIGHVVNINPDNYTITVSEYLPDNSNETIMLKWLNPVK